MGVVLGLDFWWFRFTVSRPRNIFKIARVFAGNWESMFIQKDTRKVSEILAEGKPEEIIEVKGSYTGEYLKPMLEERFKK